MENKSRLKIQNQSSSNSYLKGVFKNKDELYQWMMRVRKVEIMSFQTQILLKIFLILEKLAYTMDLNLKGTNFKQ